MDSAIIVALISGAGTLIGSIVGIIASSKLTQYRLQELEKKVDKHNSVVERTYKLEGEITEIQHDIKELKAYHKPN